MPDVVGTTSSEATATLRDAGFEVERRRCAVRSASGHGGRPESAGRQRRGRGHDRAAERRGGGDARRRDDRAEHATTTAPTTHRARPSRRPCRTSSARSSPTRRALRRRRAEGRGRSTSRRASRRERRRPGSTRRVPSSQRGDTVQLNVSTGAEPGAPTCRFRTSTGEKQAGGRRAARVRRLRGARRSKRRRRPIGEGSMRLADARGRRDDPARLARDPLRRRLAGYFGAGSSL